MAIKLSVVIPCFNEEKRFKKGIGRFIVYLKKQNYSWEVILVNDGSYDQTLQLMSSTAGQDTRVRIISYEKNKGKGYAVKRGVQKASGEIILFSDLDQAVPIKTVESFFKYFDKGYKAVIGSRRVEGSKIIHHQHLIRELLGRGFTLIVRLFVNWEIKDATCGFKAFTKEVATKIFPKITIYSWAFDAEILYLCKLYNINIIQAPVAWTDIKGSKVSVFKDVINSLAGIIKIRLNDFSNKY